MKNIKLLIQTIWRKTIGPSVRRAQMKKEITIYNKRYPEILNQIKCKESINVVFFVMNVGMWKSDGLFQLLLEDKRFNPVIVSFLYPKDSLEYRRYVQESISSYFRAKNYPYIDCFNFDNDKWFDISIIKPDVVFYTQPYNNGYDGYKIEALWHNSIFAYIPYCYQMEKLGRFHNLLLQNIAWKLFYPTNFHLNQEKILSYNKGKNISVCGYPMADVIMPNVRVDSMLWPQNNKNIIRIVWAPHHTIFSDDNLHYSNFVELAEPMFELANKYKGKIQIAFKPHPRLLSKLYTLWGKEKTDMYYKQWNEGENTTFVEGDYVELFNSSDALIHDCSSFMGEYLYTCKPLMFVAKPNCEDVLNDFGKVCFEQHYKGHNISDIINFIENVLIEKSDTMKSQRVCFYNEELLAPNNNSVAQNMYKIMVEELKK